MHEFTVHTPALFEEILRNEGTSILRIPLQITSGILHDLATRCSQINDRELNRCCARLTLYEICDGCSKSFDSEKRAKLINGEIGVDIILEIEALRTVANISRKFERDRGGRYFELKEALANLSFVLEKATGKQ